MTSDPLDDTIESPPRPVAPVAPIDYVDEDTVPVTEFVRELPLAQRIPHPDAAARADSTTPALRLVLPTGEVVVLDQTVILGRRPSAPRITIGRAPKLVVLRSPHREVSATHAEFRRVGDTVVVSDSRSTNGTAVIVPGSDRRVLIAGESAVVTPGTVVDLGDGNVLRVASAALGAATTAPTLARGDS